MGLGSSCCSSSVKERKESSDVDFPKFQWREPTVTEAKIEYLCIGADENQAKREMLEQLDAV